MSGTEVYYEDQEDEGKEEREGEEGEEGQDPTFGSVYEAIGGTFDSNESANSQQLLGEISEYEHQVRSLKSDLQYLGHQVASLEDMVSELSEQKAILEKQLRQERDLVKRQAEDYGEEVEELQKHVHSLESSNNRAEAEIICLRKEKEEEVDDLRAKLTLLESQLEESREIEANLQQLKLLYQSLISNDGHIEAGVVSKGDNNGWEEKDIPGKKQRRSRHSSESGEFLDIKDPEEVAQDMGLETSDEQKTELLLREELKKKLEEEVKELRRDQVDLKDELEETRHKLHLLEDQFKERKAHIVQTLEESFPHSILTEIEGDEDAAALSNEEVLEAEFERFALSFKTDRTTLKQRVDLQKRQTEVSEADTFNELKSFRESINKLNHLLSGLSEEWTSEEVRTQANDLFPRIQLNVEVVNQCVNRISARRENYGAVREEERLSNAFDVILLHVENLKRKRDKERAELEEARKLLNSSPSAKSTRDVVTVQSRSRRRSMPASSHTSFSAPHSSPRQGHGMAFMGMSVESRVNLLEKTYEEKSGDSDLTAHSERSPSPAGQSPGVSGDVTPSTSGVGSQPESDSAQRRFEEQSLENSPQPNDSQTLLSFECLINENHLEDDDLPDPISCLEPVNKEMFPVPGPLPLMPKSAPIPWKRSLYLWSLEWVDAFNSHHFRTTVALILVILSALVILVAFLPTNLPSFYSWEEIVSGILAPYTSKENVCGCQ